MCTFQRQFHGETIAAGRYLEFQAAGIFLHIPAANRAIVSATEIGNALCGLLGQVCQHDVIAIQQQLTLRLHAFQNFQLCLTNAGDRAKEFNMHGADIDDDRHIGLRNGRKISHFAEMIHTHFQNRHFRILRHG